MIGARKMLGARRAQPTWTLIMQFDQPDLLAASKAGVTVLDGGFGTTPTAVAGRFGDGAAIPPAMVIDWSAADGFAAAAAGATDWTLEMWVRSPSGAHNHYLSEGAWNTGVVFNNGYAITVGASWTHVALSRTTAGGYVFIGGAMIIDPASEPSSTVQPTTAVPPSAGFNFFTPGDAQYDALRMTVGAALYTAPFTPPTSPPTP